jgi:NAD(P)-dependent dehydrogenase (short-subunit alcohol dehydrogenase family)
MSGGLLAGKVAIVTGGSRGVGEAVARRFVKERASVLIASRKSQAIEAAAARIGGDVLPVAAHVAEEGAAERCMEAANRLMGNRSTYSSTMQGSIRTPVTWNR